MTTRLTPEQALELFDRRRPPRDERRRLGAAKREAVSHAALAEVPGVRRDSLQILTDQEADRVADRVPLRYERMSASPFAYLRGAAAVMASDLSLTPNTGLTVQLCGDAHLANFGMFASGERDLVFDLNDFDETHPGPFEWDVKRLVASFVVAARDIGASAHEQRAVALRAAKSYRVWMGQLSEQDTLDVWFAKVEVDWVIEQAKKPEMRKLLLRASDKARSKTVDSAVAKLTEVVGGTRQFVHDPPTLLRVTGQDREDLVERLAPVYADYVSTLPLDRAGLLAKYSFVDFAIKIVGVGSVGTRAFVMLLQSGDGEPLILQAKQAGPSVFEQYTQPSQFPNSGQRVVEGARLLQASGDPFLGWCHGGARTPYDFYFRQLWDMKGGIDAAKLSAEGLTSYAKLCGAVLARAHARVGDASLIAGYLGADRSFDEAMADFAERYADLTELDHAQLVSSAESTTQSPEG